MKHFLCEVLRLANTHTPDGYFPAQRADVPVVVLTHLAKHLGLSATLSIQYDWKGRTAARHRATIRSLLGFRESTLEDQAALKTWLQNHLQRTHDTHWEHVRAEAYGRCQTLKIEPPTPDRMDRLLDSALALYREHFYRTIMDQLSPATIAGLNALITTAAPADLDDPADSAGPPRTTFHTLRSDPGPMRVETATEEVQKLRILRDLQLPTTLFTTVPLSVV